MLLWVLILKNICWFKNVFLNEILKNVKPWLYNMQMFSVHRTSARSKHWLVSHWSIFKWVLKQDMMRFVQGSLQWDLFQYLLCTTPGYNERCTSINERIAPCWNCRKTTIETSWDSAYVHSHLFFWDKVIFFFCPPTPLPTQLTCLWLACLVSLHQSYCITRAVQCCWCDLTKLTNWFLSRKGKDFHIKLQLFSLIVFFF